MDDLCNTLLTENPRLRRILASSLDRGAVLTGLRQWMEECLEGRQPLRDFAHGRVSFSAAFPALQWSDLAVLRILDYIAHTGRLFPHPDPRQPSVVSDPFGLLFDAVRPGNRVAGDDFFIDMIELFRQLNGDEPARPDAGQVAAWMARHPSGLDSAVRERRAINRKRIAAVIAQWISSGQKSDSRYRFAPGMSPSARLEKVLSWWDDYLFHIRFAARDPESLNDMLAGSLPASTMQILREAVRKGLPIVVNPHYASLLDVADATADRAIRDYVLFSRELVDAFGGISAWEKEDQICADRPNAAGWLLPAGGNVHRRYPDSAVLIPSTGRACGGLCTSCQRMYWLQRRGVPWQREPGHLPWKQRLPVLMDYFRNDPQLKDILITGGDALMNTDASLTRVLDAVVSMARGKREDNRTRPQGERYQELIRVRLGTRIPVYIPQRVTPALCDILRGFRDRAAAAGVVQFFIQTHFESAMELTDDTVRAIRRLQETGWIITNQHVFTAASSRRGHGARLRQALGELGVLPYYTFSVKGFMENRHLYATAARLVQEAREEKCFGAVHPDRPGLLPFPATDRSIVNLPAVGKSLEFRVIGITAAGQRILAFEHDCARPHSPVIERMGKVAFVESRSVNDYVQQMVAMGESADDYTALFGYSAALTESACPVFDYPPAPPGVTTRHTNLKVDAAP